jgi:hypothetical protein
LQMAHDYHLGALVSAASAAELLGWCYTGATASDHAAKRLRVGLRFLEGIGPSYAGSDRRLATDVVGRVFNLRNFGAYGAAHGKRLVLDRALTMWLLRSFATALDRFWAQRRRRAPAPALCPGRDHPALYQRRAGLVRDVQRHLANGHMPGAVLAHEAVWRPIQSWEDQPPLGVMEELPTASPTATGTSNGYSFRLSLEGNPGRFEMPPMAAQTEGSLASADAPMKQSHDAHDPNGTTSSPPETSGQGDQQ